MSMRIRRALVAVILIASGVSTMLSDAAQAATKSTVEVFVPTGTTLTNHRLTSRAHPVRLVTNVRSHRGVVPPDNPGLNINPNPSDGTGCDIQILRGASAAPDSSIACTESALTATDNARATEGVPPLSFNLAAYEAMAPPEQLFVITNLERIGRDLAPAEYTTTQLDQYAQSAANSSTDPNFPTTLSGSATLNEGGSNWAGGYSSVLWADYEWMYVDGWGGSEASTQNEDCTSENAPGCWGHRDNVLLNNPSAGCYLVMGAAVAPLASGLSYAELLINACGPLPTDQVLSWSGVLVQLAGTGQFEVSTQTLEQPNLFTSSYSQWLEAGNGTEPYSWSVSAGSLPPDYTLSSSGDLTGPLSGPHGSYQFSVTATDSSSPRQNASAAFSLNFAATSRPPSSAGVPHAPLIRVISPLKDAIRILLESAIANGGKAISGYEYSLDYGPWHRISRQPHGAFTIGHLIRGRKYNVRLRALNANGDGASSRTAVVTTV